MLQHYVTFLYPGLLFPNESSIKINSRDDKFEIPKECFAYYFRDREEVEQDGELLTGDWKNVSGRFYFGEIFDEEMVKALVPDNKILLSNMRGNGWKELVKTRRGNFQPILENDKVIADSK